MLCNLRAELTRKNLNPEKAIEQTLGCTYKTACSKLKGDSDFTLTEALKVVDTFFKNDDFEMRDLFANERPA